MRPDPKGFLFSTVTLLLVATASQADDSLGGGFFSATLENDIFTGKDGGYTNGLGVTWGTWGLRDFSTDNLPGWIHALSRNLYISTQPGKDRAVSYTFAQATHTPSDIKVATLIEDEPPYAGLLSWSGHLHAFDDQVVDKLTLTLGLVGPASGAEAAQQVVHNVTGSDEPRGWDHQLENEPVFRLSADRLWRVAAGEDVDLIGFGQVGVGTLRSNLATGITLRYGHNLAYSFASETLPPGRDVSPVVGHSPDGWHLFFSVLGEFVANDITIDGNTFTDSHSVPLEHWQAQLAAGAVFNLDRWAVLLSAVLETDDYEGAEQLTHFGSLSVAYRY